MRFQTLFHEALLGIKIPDNSAIFSWNIVYNHWTESVSECVHIYDTVYQYIS